LLVFVLCLLLSVPAQAKDPAGKPVTLDIPAEDSFLDYLFFRVFPLPFGGLNPGLDGGFHASGGDDEPDLIDDPIKKKKHKKIKSRPKRAGRGGNK